VGRVAARGGVMCGTAQVWCAGAHFQGRERVKPEDMRKGKPEKPGVFWLFFPTGAHRHSVCDTPLRRNQRFALILT
jgi:hypothetical protein